MLSNSRISANISIQLSQKTLETPTGTIDDKNDLQFSEENVLHKSRDKKLISIFEKFSIW